MKRSSVKEPPGVKEDKDVEPLANNLAETSIQGAYDAFNAASEDFVKSKSRRMDSKALLAKHGIILKSPEAKAAAKSFNAPPSVLKVREEQLKQKGWHSHASDRSSMPGIESGLAVKDTDCIFIIPLKRLKIL